MVEIPPYQDYLSCNCICFQNEAIFPPKKIPRKLCDYVEQEKKRCEAMHDEVLKHQFFDIQTIKPCYGVSSTTALILRSSLYRHQNSIKKLKIATKKFSNIFVAIENGKVVSVNVYIQALQQLIDTTISTWVNLFKADSFICITKLAQSEKNHLETLKVLENVVKSADCGFDQLEIPVEPPQ